MTINLEHNPVENAQQKLAAAKAKQAEAERAKQAKIEAERKLERDVLEAENAVQEATIAEAKSRFFAAKRQAESAANRTVNEARSLIAELEALAPQFIELVRGKADSLVNAHNEYGSHVDSMLAASSDVAIALMYRNNPTGTTDDTKLATDWTFATHADFPAGLSLGDALEVAIAKQSDPMLRTALTAIALAYVGYAPKPPLQAGTLEGQLERGKHNVADKMRLARKSARG